MPQTQAATTPNLGMELLEANATGQSTRANGSITASDALLHLLIEDKDLNTPSGSQTAGQRFIIGPSPTGVWSDKANYIAGWYNSAWLYWAPKKGMVAHVSDENKDYLYDGSAWVLTVPIVPILTGVLKTSNFTLSVSEAAVYLVDCTSSNITISTPASSTVSGRLWRIKRIDSSGNTVTFDPNSSETIDGVATASVAALGALSVFADGTNWHKMN